MLYPEMPFSLSGSAEGGCGQAKARLGGLVLMEKLQEGQRPRSCYCLGHRVCPAAPALQAFEERSPLGVLSVGRAGRWEGRPFPRGLTEALGWFCAPGEKD